MILFSPHMPAGFDAYGIRIPLRDSRVVRTLDALARHPFSGRGNRPWRMETSPEMLSKPDLLRVHAPDFVNRLYSRRLADEIVATYELIDAEGNPNRYEPQKAVLPLEDLFGRILAEASGTLQCCRIALQEGFCFYLGGGMHHAHAGRGSGFCLINDIVIAARRLQHEKRIATAWIIDVDAHKGDGTAAVTQGDASLRTLSIHMARGWPLDGVPTLSDGSVNPAFLPSDVDIPIEAGQDAFYNEKLAQGLECLAGCPRPDLAIVVSGADPYEKDELPSARLLNLTLEQMTARDRMVYDFVASRGIPAAYLMAGGYGEHVWEVYARFLTWLLYER